MVRQSHHEREFIFTFKELQGKLPWQVVEKVISNRLFKKDRMQGAQNYEE